MRVGTAPILLTLAAVCGLLTGTPIGQSLPGDSAGAAVVHHTHEHDHGGVSHSHHHSHTPEPREAPDTAPLALAQGEHHSHADHDGERRLLGTSPRLARAAGGVAYTGVVPAAAPWHWFAGPVIRTWPPPPRDGPHDDLEQLRTVVLLT